VHLITLREILRDADVTHAISLVVREHNLSEEQTEQAFDYPTCSTPCEAALRTVLGQSDIPNGSGLFLDFPQKSSAISSTPIGAATTEGKQPPISHLRIRLRTIKRYLQALLTKSEIELKLSQCKIQ
jgi:hypothetical protein